MRQTRSTSRSDSDVVEQVVWLEKQQSGLGNDFLDALSDTMERIVIRPHACPTLTLPGVLLKVALRWQRVGRFPHVVIFETTNDEVVIHGVLRPERDLESILRARIGVN